MPVAVWRDLIALHCPNSGWVRLSHASIAALREFKSRNGLLDLDDDQGADARHWRPVP